MPVMFLGVEIENVRGINSLRVTLPLAPDIYAITGINGIGKTTLLSCIAPRLKRPVSFSGVLPNSPETSYIKYTIGTDEEKWVPRNGEWACTEDPRLPLRGFQEGSLTNGTRFFNISTSRYGYYKGLLNHVNPAYLLPADDFVKDNLGLLLQNDRSRYSNLYRLDRSKAERYYKYKGVIYYLKIGEKYISQFELSTGEFLLVNLLHLLNNLLVRTGNIEKLNLILIDEIELALHPSAIKRLLVFTKDIAREYNVAIYFSTHSLEIINGLPHIVSIIDGDVRDVVMRERIDDKKWTIVPNDCVLFLPIESLEKFLKKELFDRKNYSLMRKIRDNFFRFETEVNWFEGEYLRNIEEKKASDHRKGVAPKEDTAYFTNGKNLFSILSAKYEENGHSKQKFRQVICSFVVDEIDATGFEEKLHEALSPII